MPSRACWTRSTGLTCSPAPTSRRTVEPTAPGSMAVSAGRRKPGARPTATTAAATVAPLAPAETSAFTLPLRSATMAAPTEVFGSAPDAAGSSIETPRSATSTSTRDRAAGSSLAVTSSALERGPTSRSSSSGSALQACRAPSTTTAGAWSPPRRSTAIRGTPARTGEAAGRSVRSGVECVTPLDSDLEDLATLVRTADVADGVRQLRRAALRAGDSCDGGRLPLRPPRAGIAARHLALGYGHGGLLLGRWALRERLLGEAFEGGPTGVDLLVTVISRQFVPACPTFGTQPWAVRDAERVIRQREHDRIPQGRLQVDQVALHPAHLVLVGR